MSSPGKGRPFAPEYWRATIANGGLSFDIAHPDELVAPVRVRLETSLPPELKRQIIELLAHYVNHGQECAYAERGEG